MHNRLDYLREAQRLERLWDDAGGPDHSPKRDRLAEQIRTARAQYNRFTQAFIREGVRHA